MIWNPGLPGERTTVYRLTGPKAGPRQLSRSVDAAFGWRVFLEGTDEGGMANILKSVLTDRWLGWEMHGEACKRASTEEFEIEEFLLLATLISTHRPADHPAPA